MAKNEIVKTTEEMMAPVRALNELALTQATRFVEMQFGFARKYADLGLATFKAATTVTDADSARRYFTEQAEAARKASETALADAKALSQLGVDYMVEAQKIVKDSIGSLPKLVA